MGQDYGVQSLKNTNMRGNRKIARQISHQSSKFSKVDVLSLGQLITLRLRS